MTSEESHKKATEELYAHWKRMGLTEREAALAKEFLERSMNIVGSIVIAGERVYGVSYRKDLILSCVCFGMLHMLEEGRNFLGVDFKNP